MPEKLAIVIPYYKREFFDEALRSLAAQSDKRFTVYIGDDCSPEDPTPIIKKYQNQINIVFQKFEQNLGGRSLTGQWERCLKMMKGEPWFLILGDDDMLSDSVVKEFYDNLETAESRCNVVRFSTVQIDESGAPISEEYHNSKFESGYDFYVRKLNGLTRTSLSQFVFRTSAFSKIGFRHIPLAWGSDDLAVVEIAGDKPIFSLEPMVYVRISGINITGDRSKRTEKILGDITVARSLMSRRKLAAKHRDRLLQQFNDQLHRLGKFDFNLERQLLSLALKQKGFSGLIQQGKITGVRALFSNPKIEYNFWKARTAKMRRSFVKIKVLDNLETISDIVDNQKSVVRFGDGEFKILFKKGNPNFQEINERLAERLTEVIKSNDPRVLVCIPYTLYSLKGEKLNSSYFWLQFINTYVDQLNTVLRTGYNYGNAGITRFYVGQTDREYSEKTFSELKKIWNNRNLLIVEGELSRLGVGNDIFDNALSLQRIIAPPKNAFDRYDEILETVKQHAKDKLVLIALGPTATVLAYDLAMSGIQAVDIGHIDLEYSWMKMNAEERIPIKGKYCSEIHEEQDLELDPEDQLKYESSIILKI